MAKFYTGISVNKEVAEKAKAVAAGMLVQPTFSEIVEGGLKLFIAKVEKENKRQQHEAEKQ